MEDNNADNDLKKFRKDINEGGLLMVLSIQGLELLEEEISIEAAKKLHELILNPPVDVKRNQLIKEALEMFPEPEKSSELDFVFPL